VKEAILAYLREGRPKKGGLLILNARGGPLSVGALEVLVWNAGKPVGPAWPRRTGCATATPRIC